MKLQIIVFLLISLASSTGFSQADTSEIKSHDEWNPFDRSKTSLGIITGWHQGIYGFGEIGIGYASSVWGNHGNSFGAISLSLELEPWKKVYGYNISLWKSITLTPYIPFCLGINSVYYQKVYAHDWTLRPMIGLGFANIHLVYSYDIRLGNRDIMERNTHMFSLRYFIPTIKM